MNANTSDIYPTLLELAGAALPKSQPVLDGTSLVALLGGKAKRREKPMGFWTYPTKGRGRKSRAMLEALRQEQRAGNQKPAEPEGQIERQYPTDTLPGHAAWIDGDYKLHRVPVKKNRDAFAYELYHLGRRSEGTAKPARQHQEIGQARGPNESRLGRLAVVRREQPQRR